MKDEEKRKKEETGGVKSKLSSFFADFKTYFKRIKTPIKKPEDAAPIIAETKRYIIVAFALGIPFAALGTLLGEKVAPALEALSLVAVALWAFGGYLCILHSGMKRCVKRLENLTCDKCGAKLGDIDHTTYEEVSRRWERSDSSDQSKYTLKVTVKFTCVCPECGAVKTFMETLRSGAIVVSSTSLNDDVMPTSKLVEDYLGGLIHM